MSREICGSCDGLIEDDGTCDCDPAYVADVALLRQALEALMMMRDQYGEEACPACDHADAAVYALRERLGVTT